MGDRGQDVIGYPRPELEDPLLVAGWAEVPALAGEAEEVFVPTGITADSSKPSSQIPADEEFFGHATDDRPVEAVLLLVPGWIARFELGEVFLHALVEG